MARRFLTALLLASAVASTHAQFPGSKPMPREWRRGFDAIKVSEASLIALTLAGPDFQGRNPQTNGYPAAAGYVAAHLQMAGIRPAGDDGSYFQRITVQNTMLRPETARLTVKGTDLTWLEDFTFFAEIGFESKFKLAFARIPKGFKAKDLDLSPANGRVLILQHDDPTEDVYGVSQAMMIAPAPAPRRLMVVRPDNSALTYRARNASGVKGAQSDVLGFSALRLSIAGAKKLATLLGATSFGSEASPKPSLELPDTELTASASVNVTSQYETMNVLGVIEGSDPVLKDEYVAIGSHLDHLGPYPQGTFYGADDNGSGSTANLMLAKGLAANPRKPKRSVLIAFWACEESGLYGSRKYVADPKVPISKTIAYLNMDMVGRNADYKPWGDIAANNDDAVYNGTVRLNSPDLYHLMAEANRYVNLNIRDDKEDRTFRSDTGNFVRMGVPTAKISTGEHPDYHRVTDTPDKLNIPKLVTIARWLYACVTRLGDAPKGPEFIAGARYLTGTVQAPEGITFTRNAVIEVQLLDTTDPAHPVLIDKTSQKHPGQSPFAFAVAYRAEHLKPGAVITVRATIHEGKRMVYVTNVPVRVLTEGQPQNRVVVPVVSNIGE